MAPAPSSSGTGPPPADAAGPVWYLREEGVGEAAVTPVPAGARLVAGRGTAVDLTLRDPGVSRRHFEIENHGNRLRIRDLGSKAGTFLGGQAVDEAVLDPGDVIEAGASRLVALQLQPRVPPRERGTLEVVHYDGPTVAARRTLDRTISVGRLPGSDVVVADTRVSRRHLEIRPAASGASVVDLAPNNRVEVNGRPFRGTRELSAGDRIQLAGVDQVLVIEAADSHPGPVAVEVVADEAPRAWSVEIDAGPESSVGEVATEVGRFLDADEPRGGCRTLCREDTGIVLHPHNRWVDAGVLRGDRLVLIDVAEPPETVEQAVRYGPPRITLNQLPRTATQPGVHAVRTPRPPESQSLRGRGVSWQIVGGLGIIVAGLLIALIRPSYALFAVVGGLVGIVSIGAGIMGEQSRRRHAVRRFRERLVEIDAELENERVAQTARLHEANPSPDLVVGWIDQRVRRLWERRPSDEDFLRLRVGRGRRSALIDTDAGSMHGDGPHLPELHSLLDRHRWLDAVPILTPPPAEAPVVGIVGPRHDVLEVASWLVLQAAALHAPAELEIAVPAVNHDWMWTRWLPHVERGETADVTWNDGDAALLARRLAEGSAEGSPSSADRPARLVVVPHGAGDVLDAGHSLGTLLLVLADHVADLPSRVDAVLTVDGVHGKLEGAWGASGDATLTVDRLDHETAGRAARRMGRYADGRRRPRRTSSQLGLLDLLGPGTSEAIDVAGLWAAPPTPPLAAMIGATLDDEPLVLGLRSDGVHAVVGGTTGSGKSEFLQTFLASLALTHPPDRLAFFLIDFKGGATFAGLAELPHVAGLVTDLEKDSTLADRAFTALEAELARRKQLLEEARVPGIVEYERLPEAVSRPIPALLVVIDEFALLVRQQPDVRDRLDLVATQGRSLGVHLLLATQSPSNVISPAIRSNTQLWISLRVVDDSESAELLGRRDAALIPPDRPGRGFVRFGGAQSITGFQTARIARPAGQGTQRSVVSVRPFADVSPGGARTTAWPAPVNGRVVTELEEACAAITEQSHRLGVAKATPLWLDPLPEAIEAPSSADGLIREGGELTALVGLLDDPARTVQEPWSVDLRRAGNVLVVGTRGAGKTGTLRQIVADLVDRHPPAACHVYAVESGTGSLGLLTVLPHDGVVTAVADRERLYRTFDRLIRLMDDRRTRLAESGEGDFATWRRSAAMPEPWVVLAIDDYATFREVADGTGLGLLNDQLLSLCQGGPAVGLHVVVSAAQPSDMRMNLVNLFGARILHRQVEAADYSLLDLRLRPGEVPALPAGRALVAGGHQVQVYLSSDRRFDEIAERWRGSAGGPAPIVRLPTEVALDEIVGGRHAGPVVGVGGPEHAPVSLDLDAGEPSLVIAGDGRSGRSTALLTIHEALHRDGSTGTFTVITPRPSPLRRLVGRPGTTVAATPSEIAAALWQLAAPGASNGYLFIDDAETLGPEHGPQLESLLRDAGQLGLKAFVAGRSADLARSFEGWLRYLLSLRSGILLAPAADGGHVLDVRLPASHVAMTPGRGFLCRQGGITFLQIALPDLERSGDER